MKTIVLLYCLVDFFSLLLAALGLSADCFAVALSGSASMPAVSYVQAVRTSFSFGTFQFLMPLAGWLAGRTFVDRISAYDHWVAFALLALVGGKALVESLRKPKEDEGSSDFTRGFTLIALSVATSIDALAVGLGLAVLRVNILSTSLVIGVVAFVVTIAAFLLGRRAGRLLGKRAKFVGGLVLLGIGLRILVAGLIG